MCTVRLQVLTLLLDMVVEKHNAAAWSSMVAATAAVCTPLLSMQPRVASHKAMSRLAHVLVATWWRLLGGLWEQRDVHHDVLLRAATLTHTCGPVWQHMVQVS